MNLHIHQKFTVDYEYPVIFTKNVFDIDNPIFRQIVEQTGQHSHKLFVIIDSEVLNAYPDYPSKIQRYFLQHHDILSQVGDLFVMPGGEAAKQNTTLLTQLYGIIASKAICRHSFIVVIGGGAVIDAVGYIAATAHRGIRLIRIPTTVLAQNDAALGVKNAINFDNRKNFIGTFSPPLAVICDYTFLHTLDIRDKRAGMAEAIKVALIKDKSFFDFLYQHRQALAAFEEQAVQFLINQCATLHLEHIATNGDPFEQGSARPLDFGHWIAHKLEELSKNEMRHGEAVAIGIAIDSYYSYQLEWISLDDVNKILELLTTLGFSLSSPFIKKVNVEQALDEFRQHLGGHLTITLLKDIGENIEVEYINPAIMQASIDYIMTL